jgi:hypothetical protein
MFINAQAPIFAPGTDIKVADLEVRVHASGDDKSLWSVEFFSDFTDRWHAAAPEQAATILAHIENTDPLTWSDIRAAA